MHDELVHVPCLLGKPRNPITTLLRSPELIFEERIILCANYGKVVRHIDCEFVDVTVWMIQR
jgi:hypothetical protein